MLLPFFGLSRLQTPVGGRVRQGQIAVLAALSMNKLVFKTIPDCMFCIVRPLRQAEPVPGQPAPLQVFRQCTFFMQERGINHELISALCWIPRPFGFPLT